jgi:NAD(P)H-hydrate epimerase
VLAHRTTPTILTPHDGEAAMLRGGRAVGVDRIEAARSLASDLGATVVLKGPTTVVAEPGGRVLLSMEGDARLATAGTGDVLAGIIGAFLALGLDAPMAAAAGAWVHGRCARDLPPRGLVASDLIGQLPSVLSSLEQHPR